MAQATPSGRILLVDDDEPFRELLAQLLVEAGYEAVEASTGEDALDSARETRPALVLLDVNLPRTSGYQVCSTLREEYGESLPIIFISGTRKEAYDRVGGLLLGSDDYITKPFDADELLARVGRLVRRPGKRSAGVADGGLTRRELEILRLLADGLDQDEIAARLVISPKTVATHIQRVLKKLGARSRAQAVALAYQRGFANELA